MTSILNSHPDDTPQAGKEYLVRNMDENVINMTGGPNAPRWQTVDRLIEIVSGKGRIVFSSESH